MSESLKRYQIRIFYCFPNNDVYFVHNCYERCNVQFVGSRPVAFTSVEGDRRMKKEDCMKNFRPWSIFLVTLVGVIAFSCSTQPYKETKVKEKEAGYSSEFPSRPTSKVLAQISESVCTINCIGSYRIYPFDESERVLRTDVNEQLLRNKMSSSFFSDNSVRGTATVISNTGGKIAFLTCAHVVDFPDTILVYHVAPDGRTTKYLRSVAVKTKQFNFISPFPEDGDVDVVYLDAERDIAVLGKTIQTEIARGIPPIRFGLGNASDLNWGSFVYVFSYPAGVKMVTDGIVSSPHKDQQGSFYIDAAVTQGSSGGIVLAIRNEIPHFEIVGVVRVVPATFSYYLAPSDSAAAEYEKYWPYKGDAFVRKRTDLELGVTKCISAETVRRSLQADKDRLATEGYDLTEFLK
jgi:hypothetical protein